MNWIEINEDKTNLPKIETWVLVTHILKNGRTVVDLSSFCDKYVFVDVYGYDVLENVLAWMPLPEPFKKI
jgi:hypothetical protein